jgi:hypothetical protein
MTKTDAEVVTDTILDYFEGWFDGDTARMERALHPELAKRRAGEETDHEYLHLVRTPGGWQIANALWLFS